MHCLFFVPTIYLYIFLFTDFQKGYKNENITTVLDSTSELLKKIKLSLLPLIVTIIILVISAQFLTSTYLNTQEKELSFRPRAVTSPGSTIHRSDSLRERSGSGSYLRIQKEISENN